MPSVGFLLGATLMASIGIASLPQGSSAAGAKPKASTKADAPTIQSHAAIAIDADTGEVVYAKSADEVRAIASTGKIFVAMAVRKAGIDLNALTAITKEDAQFAKGGSRTRLIVGHKFRNQDLLRAMLISSDNRACTALGRAVGWSPKRLVAEMNKVAKGLGLKKTKFTDPSGLRGNHSTAREMSKALKAAMSDKFLASVMGTKDTTVRSIAKTPHAIHYRNTNRSLHTGTYEVSGGKTGFTTPAGYCLLIEAKVGGRRLHMSFLGAPAKLTRFGDFGRVAAWLQRKPRS